MLANSAWPTYALMSGIARFAWILIPSLVIEALALKLSARRYPRVDRSAQENSSEPIALPIGWIDSFGLAVMANAASAAVGATCVAWTPSPPSLGVTGAIVMHYGFTIGIELFVLDALRVKVNRVLVYALIGANALTYGMLFSAASVFGRA